MDRGEQIKPGSVRHMGDNGWVETAPGSKMFSTALMCAEEHYDGVRWLPIYDDCETNAALHRAKWQQAKEDNSNG